MDRQELLQLTLRQPTARCSEAEALRRLQRLRVTTTGEAKPPSGPNFNNFARDWFRTLDRENS